MPEHTVVAEAVIETLTGRSGVTVMMMLFELAGLPVEQVSFDCKTHVTVSALDGTWIKTIFVAPAKLLPLIFHWYAGDVPPLTPVAVYVTEVPEQTGFSEAEIETLTGFNGLTMREKVLETAGLPLVQVSLEVRNTLSDRFQQACN